MRWRLPFRLSVGAVAAAVPYQQDVVIGVARRLDLRKRKRCLRPVRMLDAASLAGSGVSDGPVTARCAAVEPVHVSGEDRRPLGGVPLEHDRSLGALRIVGGGLLGGADFSTISRGLRELSLSRLHPA